ncbi:MAG: nuclear transport factor 2 family protein [Caulobacter sp.]|nr:nuclear transport factor 2 family protein [Caulobacter sp.]
MTGPSEAGLANIARLEALYEAYNRGDIDTVLAGMAPDVEWFDELAGVQMKGLEALEAYWREQVGLITTEVLPLSIRALDDGRIVLEGVQTVRNPEGQEWSTQKVTHIYRFDPDGLILGMTLG